jgi:hypothetical protein
MMRSDFDWAVRSAGVVDVSKTFIERIQASAQSVQVTAFVSQGLIRSSRQLIEDSRSMMLHVSKSSMPGCQDRLQRSEERIVRSVALLSRPVRTDENEEVSPGQR